MAYKLPRILNFLFYSLTEFGSGLQLAIIGFYFGVDPLEIVDFATGILTIHIREDDL
jgi:hypothetical protein